MGPAVAIPGLSVRRQAPALWRACPVLLWPVTAAGGRGGSGAQASVAATAEWIVDGGRISSSACQSLAQVCYVHRVDIVHRDIKPANVMLIDGDLVKVLDRSTRPSARPPTCRRSSASGRP
jgi:hypothetical protein